MKIRVGGGYLDDETGEMVKLVERTVVVADDYFEKLLTAMRAAKPPEHIVISKEAWDAFTEAVGPE